MADKPKRGPAQGDEYAQMRRQIEQQEAQLAQCRTAIERLAATSSFEHVVENSLHSLFEKFGSLAEICPRRTRLDTEPAKRLNELVSRLQRPDYAAFGALPLPAPDNRSAGVAYQSGDTAS